MRTYRGIRKDNGEWAYGDKITRNRDGIEHVYIYDNSWDETEISPYEREQAKVCLENLFIEVIPETVGRSTGLTDNNGKEIYEGDILYHESSWAKNEKGGPHTFIGYVAWGTNILGFMVEVECGNHSMSDNYVSGYSKVEIIGNIHQNPELLKESEEKK